MVLQFNPLIKEHKSIIGGISNKDKLTIRIKLSGTYVCHLILRNDNNGMQTDYEFKMLNSNEYILTLPAQDVGLYWYHFRVDGQVFGKGHNFDATIQNNNLSSYQLLVYDYKYTIPSWYTGGIMYQIFPDRFCRDKSNQNIKGKKLHDNWLDMPEYLPNSEGEITNDDFFGGNFDGVKQKIDYLKSLCVNTIYFNPIFSAKSSHRYDTSNYMELDSLLGTEEQFKDMIDSLNKSQINIILDGVFNHTGDDSIYFNRYGTYKELGAYQGKKSKYYDWFSFQNFPNKYTCWWDFKTLPTIKTGCKQFEDYICGKNGVLEKYLKLGVKGYRLDVVDELSNKFVEEIKTTLRSFDKDTLLIGEVWENATNKIAYDERKKYFNGLELDSVMNYPLKDAIIDFCITGNAEHISQVVNEQIDNYPNMALHSLMNILSTHDTPRILTVLGKNGHIKQTRVEMANEHLTACEYNKGIELLKLASVIQFTLYGVPSIYYGDERGMQGNRDPFNRFTIDWSNQNQKLKIFYEKLCQIRSSYSLFKDGKTKVLYAKDKVFVFERKNDRERLIVCCNRNKRSFIIKFNQELLELYSNVKCCKISIKTDDFALFYEKF